MISTNTFDYVLSKPFQFIMFRKMVLHLDLIRSKGNKGFCKKYFKENYMYVAYIKYIK